MEKESQIDDWKKKPQKISKENKTKTEGHSKTPGGPRAVDAGVFFLVFFLIFILGTQNVAKKKRAQKKVEENGTTTRRQATGAMFRVEC